MRGPAKGISALRREESMQGKIALEEHFAIQDTLQDSAGFVPECYWAELSHRLLDIQDKRLARDGPDTASR